MESVKELIAEIGGSNTQVSASQKDENRVMKAMLNDREFKVDVYSKEGKVGEYCPAKEVRGMVASIISATTKVASQEAEKLAENYEFKKNDAAVMVDLSKEYVNTYMSTGRKLSLGGREKSNVSLSVKHIEAGFKTYPKKVGVNEDGTPRCVPCEVYVNGYDSIRVHAPCPAWIKEQK